MTVAVQLVYLGGAPGQRFCRTATLHAVPHRGDMVSIDSELVGTVGAVWWTPVDLVTPDMPPVAVSIEEHVDITPELLAAAGWQPYGPRKDQAA